MLSLRTSLHDKPCLFRAWKEAPRGEGIGKASAGRYRLGFVATERWVAGLSDDSDDYIMVDVHVGYMCTQYVDFLKIQRTTEIRKAERSSWPEGEGMIIELGCASQRGQAIPALTLDVFAAAL
jgi:hypothetical protein